MQLLVGSRWTDTQGREFVIDAVKDYGGIEYAEAKMIEYRDNALNILHSFPDSPAREALEELVRYTTDRAY